MNILLQNSVRRHICRQEESLNLIDCKKYQWMKCKNLEFINQIVQLFSNGFQPD